MASEIRVTLVSDPFEICPDVEHRVADFPSELRAFREIEDLLRRDERFETVHPRTYVVAGPCWEHFRSFRGLRGVSFVEITPRTRVRDTLGAEPPQWLSDQRVLDWGLLHRPAPAGVLADWPATIAAWVLPGIAEVASLQQWLTVVASAEDFRQPLAPGPVRDWLRDSLSAAAAQNQLSRDLIRDLAAAFDPHPSPVEFARFWLRCHALLPLVEWCGKNPLRTPGFDVGSVQQRSMARRLPVSSGR